MWKRYNLIKWISLCMAFIPSVSGQQLSFRHLGNDQGMNSLASLNCAMDKYGFIWVATSDGIVRFDGKETTYFSQQSHPEMPTDQIGFVYCDSRNHIWVCSDRGLVQLDDHRQVKRHQIIEEKPFIKVSYCFESGDNTIYALTTEGAYALENNEVVWKAQPWLDSLIAGRGYRDIRRFDHDRYLIVLPSAGVMLINLKTKQQHAFIPVDQPGCVARFDDKSILIGHGLKFDLIRVYLDQPTDLHSIKPPDDFNTANRHSEIHYIVRANDGKVYLTTYGEGLFSLDSTLSHYTHYTHDPANNASIVSNSLRYIIADSSGNLVISSLDGVNYTNVNNASVEYINYLKLESDLIDERVISIEEGKPNEIWICTKRFVFIYNRISKISRRLQLPSSVPLRFEILAPIYVERDAHNMMWVALRNEGIAIFDTEGRFKKFFSSADVPAYAKSIQHTRVIREGHDGYIYIGTHSGLFRMSHGDFKVDTFASEEGLQKLNQARIVDIMPVENGIWVSSSPQGAAWHYSFADKTLKSYNHENGLLTDRIYGLAGDRAGNLFIGSYSGLSIISPQDSIVNIVKGKGLMSPRIESIETAHDGTVWMTNNYNVLKYDPSTGDIFRLGGREGLTGVNFAIMGSTVLSSGEIVFGAIKGFVIVDPANIQLKRASLKVFPFYRDTAGREIQLVDSIQHRFTYKQQNIRFSFAVNDMMVADQVLFRYRLSGQHDGTWSTPSLNSSVDFSLDPDSYTFELEAFDGYEWFSLPQPVHFVISPPWWKQWWFLCLVCLSAVILAWIYFRNRINKYRNEMLVTRQISDLESRALRAQMNPHFVFNSLNAIQECIVTGRVEEAYTYLSKFSRLLRMVLEHSDMSEISLQEELEVLSLYITLEKLRFKNDMQYSFQLGHDIDPEEICLAPMLIQPHLENAIWHGLRHQEGPKKLSLSIHENPAGYLEVIIEDNGIGRQRSAEIRQNSLGGSHKSKGRQLSENRMDILKKSYPMTSITITDLYQKDGMAAGTKIILIIPILEKMQQMHIK